jgi:uncharacterized protein involved in copper resistance
MRLDGVEPTRTSASGETEGQLLFSRLILAFWHLQTGLQLDGARTGGDTERRVYWALGLEGIALYLGFSWIRRAGKTARLFRGAGEDTHRGGIVFEVSFWY